VQKSVSPWAMLAVICFFCVSVGVAQQSISPIVSLIIEDLHISNAEVGLFSAIVNLPGIFLIILLSMFYARIGIKRMGIIAAALIAVGSASIFLATSYWMLLVGRVIIGVGASSLSVVGLQSITIWFAGRRIGLAMGIYSTLMPLAGLLCYNTFGAAGLMWGWRSAIMITIAISLFALIIYAIFFRLPPSQSTGGRDGEIIQIHNLGKMGWPAWVLALSWGFVNMGLFAVGTFLPDFIYRSGFDLRIAGAISSTMMLISVILNPIAGIVMDKIRHRELFGAVIGVGCTLSLFILPLNVNYIIFSVMALGLFAASFATVTFTMAPGLVKKELMPLVFGIVSTSAYAGMFVGPYLTGAIMDFTHQASYGFWSAGLFFFMVAIMMLALHINHSRQQAALVKNKAMLERE
jgi:MFS family permease